MCAKAKQAKKDSKPKKSEKKAAKANKAKAAEKKAAKAAVKAKKSSKTAKSKAAAKPAKTPKPPAAKPAPAASPAAPAKPAATKPAPAAPAKPAKTPTRRPVREPAAPERLTYELVDTTMGRLLVGSSAKGVVWTSLGRSDKSLISAFGDRFPRAEIAPGDGKRARWTASVVKHVETPLKAGKMPPLDLRGTPFQLEVWNALIAIPPGETRTYGEIARAIGRPTAVRAVGQACGANPVGYVVPCHRVLGANQALTGYAGGLPTKKRLLQREGVL